MALFRLCYCLSISMTMLIAMKLDKVFFKTDLTTLACATYKVNQFHCKAVRLGRNTADHLTPSLLQYLRFHKAVLYFILLHFEECRIRKSDETAKFEEKKKVSEYSLHT